MLQKKRDSKADHAEECNRSRFSGRQQPKGRITMKKLLVFVLTAIMVSLVCVTSAPAMTKPEKEAQSAARVKAAILKLGSGPAAHVEIKLRDGTKLKGYVSEARDDGFVVVDEKTSASRDVPYSQVKQVKGNNLSSGAWVAITIGALIGIGIIVAIAARGK
jgi:hypothetical protein